MTDQACRNFLRYLVGLPGFEPGTVDAVVTTTARPKAKIETVVDSLLGEIGKALRRDGTPRPAKPSRLQPVGLLHSRRARNLAKD